MGFDFRIFIDLILRLGRQNSVGGVGKLFLHVSPVLIGGIWLLIGQSLSQDSKILRLLPKDSEIHVFPIRFVGVNMIIEKMYNRNLHLFQIPEQRR